MLDDPESEDNKSECSMEEIYTVDVIYHGATGGVYRDNGNNMATRGSDEEGVVVNSRRNLSVLLTHFAVIDSHFTAAAPGLRKDLILCFICIFFLNN